MDLKLCFSIIMVCAMAESQVLGKDWLINVPSRIPVLQSSCVVIPCVYSYPKTKKILNRWRAFWLRERTIVASNFPELRLTREFHHRTRMAGNLQSGNCTWQLYRVKETDTGPFYFRVEIPRLDSFAYSRHAVTLDVFRHPEPPIMSVVVHNKVTATCTVTHVCPTSPPKFSWSHGRMWRTRSKQENKWLWSTTSTITFTPQESDFNKLLNCTVTFPGRKTTHGSVLLIK